MTLNIMPCSCCCRQCFNFNKYFYIEFRNECPDYINVILQYKVNGKTATKPSPTFGPGKSQRITFPENANSLYFRIFDSAFNPPEIICTRHLLGGMISRFKVVGPHYGDLQCISI